MSAKKVNLKEIKPRKKIFKFKNMHIYCRNCKKHTVNTFSKSKIRVYPKFFTDRCYKRKWRLIA